MSAQRLREYRIRKLKKLVDKCRIKKIKFPKNFVSISTRLADNTDSVTDDELIALTTECLQSLDSDIENSSDSSSSDSGSSSEKPPKKKSKVDNTDNEQLLTPSRSNFDPLNPYNQAWYRQQNAQTSIPSNTGAFRNVLPHQPNFGSLPHFHQEFMTPRFRHAQPHFHLRQINPSGMFPASFSTTPNDKQKVFGQNLEQPSETVEDTSGNPHLSAASTPTPSEGISSPLMASTPCDEIGENSELATQQHYDDANNEKSDKAANNQQVSQSFENGANEEKSDTPDNQEVSQSVDGTNNGNEPGNFLNNFTKLLNYYVFWNYC